MAQESILEALEELTTCPVCQKHYEEPRMLSCMHTVCSKCIQDLIQAAPKGSKGTTTFACPSCTKPSPVKKDVETFPVDFAINSLCELTQKNKKFGGAKCHACADEGEDSLAQWFCINCVDLQCENCKDHHDNFHREHHCVSLKSGITSEKLASLLLNRSQHACNKHDKELEYICDDCSVLLCVTCKLTDETHNNHKTLYVKDDDVSQSHRKNLINFNQDCEKVLEEYSEGIEDISKTKLKYDKEGNDVVMAIMTRSQELQKAIQEQEKKLIKECDAVMKRYKKEVQADVAKFEEESEQVRNTLLITKAVETSGDNVDVIEMSLKQIAQFRKSLNNRPKCSTMTYKQRMSFDFQKVPAEVAGVLGKMSLKSRIKVTEIKKFEIDHVANSLAVTVNDQILIAEDETNKVHVYCTKNGKLINRTEIPIIATNCTYIANKEQSIYLLDFTTGKISVYNATLEHQRVIETGLEKSIIGFGIHKNKMYISSSSEHCIYAMSLDDPSSLQTFAIHQEMKHPRFMTCNKSMLVVSCAGGLEGSNNVLAFDHTGHHLFTYGGHPGGPKDGQLDGPAGLAIEDANHIFVADVNNKRIVILDDSGKYLDHIHIDCKPQNITFDCHGCLIVTTGSSMVVLKYEFIEY